MLFPVSLASIYLLWNMLAFVFGLLDARHDPLRASQASPRADAQPVEGKGI